MLCVPSVKSLGDAVMSLIGRTWRPPTARWTTAWIRGQESSLIVNEYGNASSSLYASLLYGPVDSCCIPGVTPPSETAECLENSASDPFEVICKDVAVVKKDDDPRQEQGQGWDTLRTRQYWMMIM